MAMQKAVQVANEFHCDVHVLHVQTPLTIMPFLYEGYFSSSIYDSHARATARKLQQLREIYSKKLNDGLLMTISQELGDWQTMMKKTIIADHTDLVLIPKHPKRFFGALVQKININKLIQQTQCPVLTVTRRFNIHHLQNIVVPVGHTLPIRKLTMATYLARQGNGHVHLLGCSGKNKKDEKRSNWCVTRAYQLLRDYTQVNIHCTIGADNNNMEGMLIVAKNVKADLIVVNSGKETQPAGWLNRLLGRYLYKESNIPVLTVAGTTN
jgi:nucleotide-binding universal stress UspA family protein